MISGPASITSEVRHELAQLAKSRTFGNAQAQIRLLHFLLSNADDSGSLKETYVGTVFYGRDATFDPRSDSIVRTNVSRLRQRLEEYYAAEGSESDIIISLPRGCYEPRVDTRFRPVVPPEAESAEIPATTPPPVLAAVEKSTRRPLAPRWYGVAASLIMLSALTAWATARHASRARPTVAVLELHNLDQGTSQDWIGVGVEESLRSNLERDDGARTLTGLQVAEAEHDLPAVSTGVYDKTQIQAYGRRLHCDYVVTGFYSTNGNKLRLDMQMRDASTGEVRSSVEQESPTDMLFAQTHGIANHLREALGRPALVPVAAIQDHDSALPEYWEGLQLLRQDRYVEATELLSRAVALSPQSPLAHLALAGALKQMGYEGKAAEEARIATQFAGGLPREEHLRLTALASEYQSAWNPSEIAYTELRALDPGNSDYVLGADRALIAMGHLQQAATDLASFTQNNPAARADARFSLMRASAAAALTDHHSELVFAGEALQLARASSSHHLEAQSLIREGWAWAFFGDEPKAEMKAREALTIAEKIGNITDILSASSELGQVQASFPDPHAKDTLQRALELARRAGARLAQSSLLLALGNLADEDEDFVAERDYNQQALDITSSGGPVTAQLPELANLAQAAEGMGDYAEERKYCERVLAISQATGNQEMLAQAHLALSRLAVRADDRPLAQAELQLALEYANQMDSKEQIAEALQAAAQFALDNGDIAQASQLADRVTAMHVTVRFRIVRQKLLLGELELRRGKPDAAIQQVKELAAAPARAVYPTSAALRITAEANLLKGDLSSARMASDKAVASARHASDPASDLVRALLLRAKIEKASNNGAASNACLLEARTLAERSGSQRALREANNLQL